MYVTVLRTHAAQGRHRGDGRRRQRVDADEQIELLLHLRRSTRSVGTVSRQAINKSKSSYYYDITRTINAHPGARVRCLN